MKPTDALVQPAPTGGATHPHTLLQAFQSLLYLLVVALFLITFTVQPFRIPSESMEPTLLVGDFLLVEKQVGPEGSPPLYPPLGDIHRGDLIVFHYPLDPGLHLVKRIVGLPGDRLRLHDGRVILNGLPLSEPYAVFRPAGADAYRDDFPHLTTADPGVDSRWWIQMHTLVAKGELTVPPESYFVLGDNRNNSEDSRYWGLVPSAAIIGKPFLVYFSLNTRSGPSPSRVRPPADSDAPASTAETMLDFIRWNRSMHVLR